MLQIFPNSFLLFSFVSIACPQGMSLQIWPYSGTRVSYPFCPAHQHHLACAFLTE